MSEKVEAIIIADEEQAPRLAELSTRLRKAGCLVTSELDFLSQIIVQCDEDKLLGLEKLKGVSGVERSGEVQLPPPEGEVL